MRSRSRNKSGSAKGDDELRVEVGSGNVFADMGLPRPEIALAKAELVRRIRDLIVRKKLTQVKAAALLGLDQPKVSALIRGKVDGYTIGRLLHCLNALGQRVEITVRPVRAGAGKQDTMVVVG